jgi:hypothetical protein
VVLELNDLLVPMIGQLETAAPARWPSASRSRPIAHIAAILVAVPAGRAAQEQEDVARRLALLPDLSGWTG